MASPRLDHRLPGAGAVCLFVSRRTISLSVNEELEQGQGVSLWEGAEGSRVREGRWACCSCTLGPEELPLRNLSMCLSCISHFELSWAHQETNAFGSLNGGRFFVIVVIFLVSVFVSSPSSSSLLSKIAKSCILLPSCLL